MDQEKRSLFQRIRNIRQSLENAEKSFQDDRGMRGELDLMLAEAELKNLRNKQSIPWSWNRHVFAFSIAVLLCASGLCGWYFAKGNAKSLEPIAAPAAVQQGNNTSLEQKKNAVENNQVASNPNEVQKNTNASSDTKTESKSQVYLSDKDIRNLVRSAKSELSSGK